jgi:hypothetical protein
MSENKLYVGNLSFNANTDSVREAFSAFGEVTDVHVVSDRETGQSRGFGFVTLGTAEAAQNQDWTSKNKPPADKVSETIAIRTPRGRPGPRIGLPWTNQYFAGLPARRKTRGPPIEDRGPDRGGRGPGAPIGPGSK